MSDTAPRPRVIERWFPCAEVSAASGSGWGSSNSETLLMSWFAKRPLAQARAAVLCSLLPWPEDEAEQEHIQAVIKESLGTCVDPEYMQERSGFAPRPHAHGIQDCARYDKQKGYNAARRDVITLLEEHYPKGANILDPFSGRGLLPLEGARFGIQAHAIDYSPIATLASRLLIDFPFRNWSAEPPLPFDPPDRQASMPDLADPQRLVADIETVQAEVQRRWSKVMDPYYPDNEHGEKPWGYLWATIIPCSECGRTFPLYGSNTLRQENSKRNISGQSFELIIDGDSWEVRVVDGQTDQAPTMYARRGKRGKLAWCPYAGCGHAHELAEHKRLVREHYGEDVLLVVADIVAGQKSFRCPSADDLVAVRKSAEALLEMEALDGLPARPDERHVPGTSVHIRATEYGAQDFGDLSVDRQNFAHAHLARVIAQLGDEIRGSGGSADYAQALTGYCGAVFARKLKYSTRGSAPQTKPDGSVMVNHVFINESSVGFNYDSFEAGVGSGPATWSSVSGVPAALKVLCDTPGRSAHVQRASALAIPVASKSLDAVVTDPPYDFMIAYSDASDLFWVWLRRALGRHHFDFALTAHESGLQEKDEEIIVKQNYFMNENEHRVPEFYDTKIAEAFAQCGRVVKDNGVVTIVFGHGEPDVWKRLLTAIDQAGLVLTGSWPAQTEKGGSAGSANIVTTLTLACRLAPANRKDGRVAEVDAEVRRVVADRVKSLWDPAGLAVDDQLMAAAGPAMEVVGRYERVLDKKGQPVDISRYLPLARRAVEDAQDIRLDSLPLATFDARTRFGLFWARLYGRRVRPASEARWQRLAADLEEGHTAGVLEDVKQGTAKGVRLAFADEARPEIEDGSPILNVALAAAHGWRTGSLADAARALRASGRDPDDPHLWACVNALSKALPESDRDGEVFTRMVRNRESVVAAARNVEAAEWAEARRVEVDRQVSESNPALFEDPNSLFGQEGNGA